MTAFETLAAVLSFAAAFAYVNHRWLRQPPAIGLMALSLSMSILLIAIDRLGWVPVTAVATGVLERIDLDDTLLHGMLGVLLFAGSLHVNLDDLREERAVVIALAVVGTLLSTFLVGGLIYPVLHLVGAPLSFVHCLLFGALISPTDPIAVLGILKKANVPRKLEIQIAGESLFNDGIGVVIFLSVLQVLESSGAPTPAGLVALFAREAIGGALFGIVSGYITYRLLKSIDHYQTELMLTLALVAGGYALAERLHLSAPVAAVTAGLLIGNRGRTFGMSDTTRDHLDKFWSLVDEVMNAILFVLVGFELIRLQVTWPTVLAGVFAIGVVLLARLMSVAGPVLLLSVRTKFAPGTVSLLTWGGLRGAISVALSLSTPAGSAHGVIVTMTYVVVVFSILVQGLTLGRLASRLAKQP